MIRPEPIPASSYRPAPFLRWSVESHGLRVVDLLADRGFLLSCPEDVVWEFLTQGRPLDQVVRMVGATAGLPHAEAERRTLDLVRAWEKQRWIEPAIPSPMPWPTSP